MSAAPLALFRRAFSALPKVEYHQIGYPDFAARYGNSIDRAFVVTRDSTNF
jgi:hypothetical protein